MTRVKDCIRDKFETLNINVHKFNYVNIILIIVASVISSLALLKDNYQTVIASKLIGLAIIPFISLCIMIIAGSKGEIIQSAGACAKFMLICLLVSGIIGFINLSYREYYADSTEPSMEMMIRAQFKYENIILELVMSGVAGVGIYYAIMKTSTIALVGLILAISIIPPLCNAGLFWGMTGYMMLEGKNENIEKSNTYIDYGTNSFVIFASNITGMFLGFMIAFLASCVF